MTYSYVLSVELVAGQSPITSEDLAQYIRTRLESQDVVHITNISGIISE